MTSDLSLVFNTQRRAFALAVNQDHATRDDRLAPGRFRLDGIDGWARRRARGSHGLDLRRDRNITAIKEFLPQSDLMAIYLHYLVPRISEVHSWLVDETVDCFGKGHDPIPTYRIFPSSATAENDLPAWKQEIPIRQG